MINIQWTCFSDAIVIFLYNTNKYVSLNDLKRES